MSTQYIRVKHAILSDLVPPSPPLAMKMVMISKLLYKVFKVFGYREKICILQALVSILAIVLEKKCYITAWTKIKIALSTTIDATTLGYIFFTAIAI
jgi:hypothetical protein